VIDSAAAVLQPARLAEVRRTRLLDTGPEEPFDRLTRLACEVLGAPFGFVTVVDDRRSFWKSCIGVTSTDVADRQKPVEESFCQYVIATDEAVIVDDARLDPMTADNPSIESMGVIAFAGYPVRSPSGHVLGTFCVVDTVPRHWTAQDRHMLEVLAHAAEGEVALRVAADEAAEAAAVARADADRYQLLARTMQETLLPGELPAIDGLDVTIGQRVTGRDVPSVFYDAARTPTGWAIFAGRAAGSGVRAGRTAVMAKHLLRAAAERTTSPAIVLTDLNAALQRWFDDSGTPLAVDVAYVALRAGPGGFTARICVAGEAVVVVRPADGAARPSAAASPPLGGPDRIALKVEDVELRPGDSLWLVTGGDPADAVGASTPAALVDDSPVDLVAVRVHASG
jgi:phosphoserine phosphatase RsbU/P